MISSFWGVSGITGCIKISLVTETKGKGYHLFYIKSTSFLFWVSSDISNDFDLTQFSFASSLSLNFEFTIPIHLRVVMLELIVSLISPSLFIRSLFDSPNNSWGVISLGIFNQSSLFPWVINSSFILAISSAMDKN